MSIRFHYLFSDIELSYKNGRVCLSSLWLWCRFLKTDTTTREYYFYKKALFGDTSISYLKIPALGSYNIKSSILETTTQKGMNKFQRTNAIEVHRSINADLLKAISITAVVFIHSSFLIPFSPSHLNWVLPGLRFCVPVFILLWAYFAEKAISKRRSEYKYLATRFYRLLIPFIFWSIVYFFITADLQNLTFTKILTRYWAGYGWSGQYYFIILFQLILLFSIIRRISYHFVKFPMAIIIISILFYNIVAYSPLFTINSVIKLGDRLFLYWLPYVVLGIIYARVGIPKQVPVPLFIAATAPIIIPIEFYYLHPLSEPYLTPGIFISSLLLFMSIMGKIMSFDLSSAWFINSISLLARNTLGIFCLNPLVILFFSSILNRFDYHIHFLYCSLIITVLSTLLIISTCLGLIFVLKRVKLSILVAN